MSTATRTTTARKAMRAATVFTGAAGLAVGFGPTAMAATGQAPAQGHSARATGTTPANIQLTAADIVSKGCTTNDWLHIEYSSLFRDDLCRQFGYVGYAYPYIYMNHQCGGNNFGNLYVSGYLVIPFGRGTGYRTLPGDLSTVSISGYGGSYQCPWPR
jgi:hypothetical protein